MSVIVSSKKQIVFFVLCIFIIFGILEGIAKIWWSFVETCAFEDNDVYQDVPPAMKRQMCVESYQTQFSSTGMESNQDFETININSYGFRGKEVSIDKPQNVYRIFTVGGSTMLGTGSTSDVTTIAGFLQSKFDQMNLDLEVEVINGGVSGAWSHTETNYIKTKLVDFEPDLFIIYDGWNDASHSLNIDEDGSDSVKAWIERWNEICNLGKRMNFDTIIIIQPIVGTGDKILTGQEFEFYKDSNHKKLLDRLELFAQSLNDLESTCSKTADLRTAFDGLEIPIYWDAGHMGNAGNEIISSKIFDLSFPFVTKKDISETSKPITEGKSIEINNDSFQYQKDVLVLFKRTFLHYIKSPLMIQYFFFDSEKDIVTHLPNRDNREQNTLNIDFSSPDLSNQDISRVYLFKVDLSNKVLSNTNFASSYLREGVFIKSDLSNANLVGANLGGADLSHANLTNADLRKTNLSNSILKGAILRGTQLDGVVMYNTNLRDADLSGVDFSNTILRSVDFQGAEMKYVNLSGHDLRRMFFMESDLSFANLQGTFIEPMFFKNAMLRGTNLSGAVMEYSDFSGMDLTDTDFSFAFIYGSDFSNSNLNRTNFLGANIEFVNFGNSNLESSFGSPFIGCNNHTLCISKNQTKN